MITLEEKMYYTPRKSYRLCVGVSTRNETLSRGMPLFQVNYEGLKFTAGLRGAEGLMEIAASLKEHGYRVPKGFGQTKELKEILTRVKLRARSIEIRVPQTEYTPDQRHSFQYRDSFGSFNNAMYSALSTLHHFNVLIDALNDNGRS